MKNILRFLKLFNKSKGQGVVEYGLILIITILAAGAVVTTQNLAEETVTGSIEGHSGEKNPKSGEIVMPDPVTGSDVWDRTPPTGGKGLKLKPVAFFTLPNPMYTGEKITYWDNSYDPDGQIVDRTWTGKVDTFNKAGQYKIKLTVRDNDDLTDSFEMTINVTERETYKELLYDHANEQRRLVTESPIYNVGSPTVRILDHIYGRSTDLYNVKHVTIQKNYWETVVQKARDITYEVKIPIIEVTYDGRGNEISRTEYKIDGVPQYVTQNDTRVVPEPADIKVEWKDNTWTYYVYNRISSVQNPNNSWGQRNPSADYARFDPEIERTTQSPTWSSSRTTTKDNSYNAGYNATSTPCKTCTIPNQIDPKTTNQNDYRSVSCSVGTSNELTHKRTYNYIEHKAYDTLYKYTGTGLAVGTYKEEKKLRHEWKTEGWKSDEMVGTSGYSARAKYTDCDGNGWSEDCWKPQSTSEDFDLAWELYDTDTGTEDGTRTENQWVEVCKIVNKVNKCADEWLPVEIEQERTYTTYYYKRQEWTCKWSGTTLSSENYVWGYYDDTIYGAWYDK